MSDFSNPVSAHLPIRQVVLYKHGVGFFERQGRLAGAEAELSFRAEEMNDILKSLIVIDRAGGQVLVGGAQVEDPLKQEVGVDAQGGHLREDPDPGQALRETGFPSAQQGIDPDGSAEESGPV